MDTVRVKIRYRPLRICWAIGAGDIGSFRRAVELSYTMWGGRYNPIVVADQVAEADNIVKAFRADLILPVGDAASARAFPARFPYLINPFFHEDLFLGTGEDARAQLLDVHNAVVELSETPAAQAAIEKRGVRLYRWDDHDPLSDTLLIQFGRYPSTDVTQIDYRGTLQLATSATEVQLNPADALPADCLDHPSIAYFARHNMRRRSVDASSWDFPGFFLGDASNLADLVTFWNLRARDGALWFVDPNHLARLQHIIPAWTNIVPELLARRKFEYQRGVAIWSRRGSTLTAAEEAEDLNRVKGIFGEGPHTLCHVYDWSWSSRSLRAPTMVLGETSQLGVLVTDGERPKLSFALADKPFSADPWFHAQHLVASLSFIGGLYNDDLHTLTPPYVPELNEFLGREMLVQHDSFRIEPTRIGLVIDATDSDVFVRALRVSDLCARVFALAGFVAKPSSAGLITRQLITQMGGLRGAAVFKVPGVRRLVKTFGPTESFSERDALNKIGSKDPDNPTASFKDHAQLYIEPRPPGSELTASDVFAYLAVRGLFRMGAKLACPHCGMSSWTALDSLKQRVTCEMCGRDFDATRQLVANPLHYRRSGVLGAERNAQGAIPVTLTLQQLESNLGRGLRENLYTTSVELAPTSDPKSPICEIDFIWIVPDRNPDDTIIVLGECKDRGVKAFTEDEIDKLRIAADALAEKKFDTYVLLAKLAPFTAEEIALAKSLNRPHHQRAILLTDQELEPWRMYERAKIDLGADSHATTVDGMARVTAAMYFAEAPPPAAGGAPPGGPAPAGAPAAGAPGA